MANKSNAAISINREVIISLAEYCNGASNKIEENAAAINAAAKVLCNPDCLDGKDMENFKTSIESIQNLANTVSQKFAKAAQVTNKAASQYENVNNVQAKYVQAAKDNLVGVMQKIKTAN